MDNRALLAGAGFGAALMFLLDPDRGARRRAIARDKIMRGSRLACAGAETAARDMAHRASGIVHEARARMQADDVEDDTLIERVRARLGRACSHPRAIDVAAHDGDVTLRGQILASEVDLLMTAIAEVRGVCSICNELEPHESRDGIPSLQGRGHVARSRVDILQETWAPGTRALVGLAALAAAGGAAAAYARH